MPITPLPCHRSPCHRSPCHRRNLLMDSSSPSEPCASSHPYNICLSSLSFPSCATRNLPSHFGVLPSEVCVWGETVSRFTSPPFFQWKTPSSPFQVPVSPPASFHIPLSPPAPPAGLRPPCTWSIRCVSGFPNGYVPDAQLCDAALHQRPHR